MFGPALHLMTQMPEEAPGFNEGAEKPVLFSVQEHDVRFIRLWFTDMLGILKGFAITVDGLEEALCNGASFDGASVAGKARVEETGMVTLSDPSTWQLLPWQPAENVVARPFCDLRTPDGAPAAIDGRVLDSGFTFFEVNECLFRL